MKIKGYTFGRCAGEPSPEVTIGVNRGMQNTEDIQQEYGRNGLL
jgi:hypothetical protein